MDPSVAAVLLLLCVAKAAHELELVRIERALWTALATTVMFATPTFTTALLALTDFEAAEIQETWLPVMLDSVDWLPSTTTTSAP